MGRPNSRIDPETLLNGSTATRLTLSEATERFEQQSMHEMSAAFQYRFTKARRRPAASLWLLFCFGVFDWPAEGRSQDPRKMNDRSYRAMRTNPELRISTKEDNFLIVSCYVVFRGASTAG
jgi:hypothetical protein